MTVRVGPPRCEEGTSSGPAAPPPVAGGGSGALELSYSAPSGRCDGSWQSGKGSVGEGPMTQPASSCAADATPLLGPDFGELGELGF